MASARSEDLDETPECLRPMTEEELAAFVPLTEEQLDEAMEKGRQDAERAQIWLMCASGTLSGLRYR